MGSMGLHRVRHDRATNILCLQTVGILVLWIRIMNYFIILFFKDFLKYGPF